VELPVDEPAPVIVAALSERPDATDVPTAAAILAAIAAPVA
jgi:hypothetical protein